VSDFVVPQLIPSDESFSTFLAYMGFIVVMHIQMSLQIHHMHVRLPTPLDSTRESLQSFIGVPRLMSLQFFLRSKPLTTNSTREDSGDFVMGFDVLS
jgi:hypothetical protein